MGTAIALLQLQFGLKSSLNLSLGTFWYNEYLWSLRLGNVATLGHHRTRRAFVPGLFLAGVFEENARLLQWLLFIVSSMRSVHFLCTVHFYHK